MSPHDLTNVKPCYPRKRSRRGCWISFVLVCVLFATAVWLLRQMFACGGNITKTQGNIGTLQGCLMQYKVKYNRLPSESEGLEALITSGITEDRELLTDPWGEPVRYRVPGVRSGDKFDVYSTGKDEIDGNEDDIGNWEPPG